MVKTGYEKQVTQSLIERVEDYLYGIDKWYDAVQFDMRMYEDYGFEGDLTRLKRAATVLFSNANRYLNWKEKTING